MNWQVGKPYQPFDFSNGALQQGTAGNGLFSGIGGTSLFGIPPAATFATPDQMAQAIPNLQGLTGNTNSFFGNGQSLGFNMPTMQLGLQGLGALSSLYFGSKALGMAKDQFNFQKEVTNTNLNNSINAYNTSLEDRLRTREQFNNEGQNTGAWKSDFERLKATR